VSTPAATSAGEPRTTRAAVGVANKLARIAWAVWKQERLYKTEPLTNLRLAVETCLSDRRPLPDSTEELSGGFGDSARKLRLMLQPGSPRGNLEYGL
jgi:hypothetical protein